MSAPLIEMKNISIDFPGVAALKNVHFRLEKGEIHALIGANGAGKSSLMKILSGAYGHYRGDILIQGEKTSIRTPKAAKQQGIQMVFQEVDTALVPSLTVAENIMLQQMVYNMGTKQLVKWKDIHKQAADILKKLHVDISTSKLVQELTLAEKQMVLIARAVSDQCQTLILDEPTAPLSGAETKELFRLIHLLKEQSVAVIFISHRLPELFEICEKISVMRNGEIVFQEAVASTSQNEVVECMLGKTLEGQYPSRQPAIGEPILETKGLSDTRMVKNLSIHIKKSEIVGVAGLVGAGKTEICKALFGASTHTSGDVIVQGKKVKITSPSDAFSHGIALVPEERRKEGLVISESVLTNLSIANLRHFTKVAGFIDFKSEKNAAESMIKQLGIRTPSAKTKAENLSGGNQQKVAVGKWLLGDASVYLFDEPTKGVDVGAKREIFELITELAIRGKGILYASSEIADILGMTDRVYVVYDGKVVKELETKSTNEEEILYYSTGGK